MEMFLRVEKDSNILGAKEKSITFIALSSIVSIAPDFNGGSVITYGKDMQLSVENQSPDNLLTNSVFSVVDTPIVSL